MADALKVDLCVIGAGSGGLSVAAGASQLGASVVLLEKHKMGGDCLNYGCVPSKALLAAGHAAAAHRHGAAFGVNGAAPVIDGRKVHDHVHGVIAAIAPQDSVERFQGLGVNVIEAAGRFVARDRVAAGDREIRARRFVIATGSRPLVPPIPGLDDVPYATNETIFDSTAVPKHLIVIGGGPIGLEMAQAHRNLGAEVTVLEMFEILPKDDPELVSVIRNRLRADGIDIQEQSRVVGVRKTDGGIGVDIENGDGGRTVEGTHLLLAAGRKANVEDLGLEAAGVDHAPTGIEVDARLRTTNKKIWAIGDCAGGHQFTHVAGYHAGIAIRNILFRLPAKADHSAVPWVTYTDPELAHVGLNEADAKQRHGDIRVLRWPYAENDRAQAERLTDGLIKAITARNGRVLGATIAGAHAGELIQPWVLAVSNRMKISKLASMIAPYPTLGEVSKRAAGSFFTPSLFSDRTRRIVRFLNAFG